MRISVIGTGYLGATHAACMAHLGHEVIAYDIDQKKIAQLSAGDLPFFEPGLEALLKSGIANQRLKFTSDLERAITNSEVHFLCVGTPQLDESGSADISQIRSAVELITPLMKHGDVLVGKSTVPVGTSYWITNYLKQNSTENVSLVWNPEFLREGFAVEDTLNPDRIVLGAINQDSVKILAEVYSKTISNGTPVIYTDFATAELVKVAANAFLATKISFINAFSDLCDAAGANVTTLADAIGYDSRIGRKFLNAGIGFGGGCLPKDIRALHARASELGLAEQFSFIKEVDEINKSRIKKIIEITSKELGLVKGKKIAILGASFKPNSDDIRNSPSLDILKELELLGADVYIHDPVAVENIKTSRPEIKASNDLREVIDLADILLHLTEWNEYRKLDPKEIGAYVRQKIIIDGRNVLDENLWRKSGWKINFLGKPSS